MAATLGQRIQDLIGFDYTADAGNMLTEDEALETACAEVIDALPDSLLLRYAVTPLSLTSGSPTVSTDGLKVLRVIRKAGSSEVYRVCQEVDIEAFEEMKDTDSIYAPTSFSPIYTFDPASGTPTLKILPEITGTHEASVYYITYPVGADIDSGTGIDGLPNEVEHAIALKAAIYILQTKISDAVQDEEDEEELAMLSAQAQSLVGMYTSEIARLANIEGEEAKQ